MEHLKLEEILEIIDKENITAYKIAQETDLTEVGINKIINGDSKNPRKNTLQRLSDYLLSYVNKSNKADNYITKVSEEEAKYITFDNTMMVPLVLNKARAGFLSGWGDTEYIEHLPKVPFEVDQEYKGKYICFEVSGDSMDDGSYESLLEKDILLCREVQRIHWKNKLHINKWNFVIVHKTEGILVKRITEHNTDNGKLRLHSLNEYYEDQEVFMDDLIAIFNVVDVKRSLRR